LPASEASLPECLLSFFGLSDLFADFLPCLCFMLVFCLFLVFAFVFYSLFSFSLIVSNAQALFVMPFEREVKELPCLF